MRFTLLLLSLCVAAPAALAQTPSHTTNKVPLAAHDLVRGSVLSAADIAWSDTAPTAETPHLTPGVAAGWVVHRNMRAGEVLTEPSVSQPDLVTSGSDVDVIYVGQGVSVKVHGVAIGNGGNGDEVYVRLDNRKRLRATVAGPNTVRVM